MFTGIIESICRVVFFNGRVLRIELGNLAREIKPGDSVAVNGLCLTAAEIQSDTVSFDVSPESLARSKTAKLKAGDMVNIELAMRADGRFDGHIVQGHIDGTATVKAVSKKNDFWDISFLADSTLLEVMVKKGSVAIDGISLTITEIDDKSFGITVIPVTIKETTLANISSGDTVNIETDIIAKVIRKQILNIVDSSRGLTMDKLKSLGF